jgi:hypothetical protein
VVSFNFACGVFNLGGFMSKGSRQRPRSVNADKFSDNWDRIFKKPADGGKKDEGKNSGRVRK